MIINGKEYNINDLVEEIDIDKNIPKKRKNGLVLRDSWIDVLKRYNIDYENYSSINSLITEIEEILIEEGSIEELENLSEELQEMEYYNYTNK